MPSPLQLHSRLASDRSTVGYGYPNDAVVEQYLTAGSPYWGLKLFAAAGPTLDSPLHDRLAEALGVPVAMDNPLKAGAIAELWFGAGVDARHLVSVTLGTGDGASAGDGAAAAATGVATDELGGVALLGQAVRAGDPTAARVVAETGRYLGAGLANLVNLVNPDTIVLGGWVVDELEEWLLPAVRAEAAARALPRAYASVQLLRSPISGHRTCLGIATFALERFLSDLGVPSRRVSAAG